MSLVDYQSSDEDSENEEESNEKPSVESKPTILPPSKKKEPVKFTLPSLDQFEDDDDDDDNEYSQLKKPKLTGPFGLLGMLPAPKYTFKTTSLVPNTVSRKIPTAKKQDVVKKLPLETVTKEKYGADDDETGNTMSDFFSLGADSTPPIKSLNLPPPRTHVESFPLNEAYSSSANTNPIITPSENVDDLQKPTCSGASYATVDYEETPSSSEPSCEMPQEGTSQDADNFMNDEGFLRLQGRRRGKEDVNIIDISGDSLVSEIKNWQTKSLTEEKRSSFSRKKHGMPSQMQRRKHQITYLAFQAKERELDLKNQWAENRLTKQQTQSKYGF